MDAILAEELAKRDGATRCPTSARGSRAAAIMLAAAAAVLAAAFAPFARRDVTGE